MTRSPLISVSVSAAAAAILMALAMPASAVDSEIYGAPGLVPHPVKDYLPITVNKNMCVMCIRSKRATSASREKFPSRTSRHRANLPVSGMNVCFATPKVPMPNHSRLSTPMIRQLRN